MQSQSRPGLRWSQAMGMPRPETKWSHVFGKIPDQDQDCGVWSGPDRVPIGPGPNFPNTSTTRPPKAAGGMVLNLTRLCARTKKLLHLDGRWVLEMFQGGKTTETTALDLGLCTS